MIRANDDTTGTKTILVVEDEKEIRGLAVEFLESLDHEVLEAGDGPSALDVLGKKGKGVDLVFSDVDMPSGISGFELAGVLSLCYPRIKVLLTSGDPKTVIGKDGIRGTGITVLRKPYKIAELAEAVRTTLDQ